MFSDNLVLISGCVVQRQSKDYALVVLGGGTTGELSYAVRAATTLFPEQSETTSVALYCNINKQDSSRSWYAFRSLEQRTFFTKCLTVEGMGPGFAYKLFERNTWDAICKAMQAGAQAFGELPGLKPSAKDSLIKVLQIGMTVTGEVMKPNLNTTAVDALVNLGIAAAEARRRVANAQLVAGASASVEQIITLALQNR